MRAHRCDVRHSNVDRKSWLRLRCALRRLAGMRGPGLTPLIVFTLMALASLAAALALSVPTLSVPTLPVPALPAPLAPVPPVRRQVGRRRLLVLANDDLGAIGQVGKAGRHHAIGGRQS